MSRESKIGVFVLIGLTVMAYFVYRTSDVKKWLSGEQEQLREVAVVLADASGMRKGTSVEIAGVKIGVVKRIELEGENALAIIDLPAAMAFKEGAHAEIRSKGVLGERYVSMHVGSGSILDSQDRILGKAPPDLGQVTATVQELAQNLVQITESLKQSTLTDQGGNRISQIALNLEKLTQVLVDTLQENRGNMQTTSAGIAGLVSSLNQEIPLLIQELTGFSQSLRSITARNKNNIDETARHILGLSANFEAASSSLSSIAAKVDEGSGSLGQLINNSETSDHINEVLANVNESVVEVKKLIGRATSTDLEFMARSEYLSGFSATKNYLGIKIAPDDNKYYLIEGVSVGNDLLIQGTNEVTEQTYDADGNLLTTTVRSTIDKPDEFLISGQLAYRLGPIFLRGGVIESEGGGGVDYFAREGQLKLSLEAFDFSRDDLGLHGRLDFRYNLSKNLHLNAGWDDFLETQRASSVFGAGLRWRDDDLKLLFTTLGRFR